MIYMVKQPAFLVRLVTIPVMLGKACVPHVQLVLILRPMGKANVHRVSQVRMPTILDFKNVFRVSRASFNHNLVVATVSSVEWGHTNLLLVRQIVQDALLVALLLYSGRPSVSRVAWVPSNWRLAKPIVTHVRRVCLAAIPVWMSVKIVEPVST